MSYIETCGDGEQLKQFLSCGVRYVVCYVEVALRGLSGVPIGALWVVLQLWLLASSICRTFLDG